MFENKELKNVQAANRILVKAMREIRNLSGPNTAAMARKIAGDALANAYEAEAGDE